MDSVSVLLAIYRKIFMNKLKRMYLLPDDSIEKEEFMREMLEYRRLLEWLSKKFSVTKEAVRYHLKKLKKVGYLKREVSLHRRSFYGLTEVGERVALLEFSKRFSIDGFARSVVDNFHSIIDGEDIPSTIQVCYSLSRYGFKKFLNERIEEVLKLDEEEIVGNIIKERNLREGMIPEELLAWMISFKLLLASKRMIKINEKFLRVAKKANKKLNEIFNKHEKVLEDIFIPWIPARILINYSLSSIKNRKVTEKIRKFLLSLVKTEKPIGSLDVYRVPVSETTSVILESLLLSGETKSCMINLFRKILERQDWRFDPHKISHVLRVGYLLSRFLRKKELNVIEHYTRVLLVYGRYLWVRSIRKDFMIDVKSHPKAEVASTILEFWEEMERILNAPGGI